jgi:ABC-type maltose transport system permease subunit
MPLAKPILVLVALTNFTGPWFDFIFPKLTDIITVNHSIAKLYSEKFNKKAHFLEKSGLITQK